MDKQNTAFWTEDETEQLIEYWNGQGKSSQEVGIILGKTPGSVISKIRRLRRQGVKIAHRTRWGIRKEQPLNKDQEYRKCLKCRKPFISNHCLNRVCKRCTLVNAGVYEASIMRVLK